MKQETQFSRETNSNVSSLKTVILMKEFPNALSREAQALAVRIKSVALVRWYGSKLLDENAISVTRCTKKLELIPDVV
eukprot:1031212-Prorocentrum_minimum.AAC.1